MAAKDETGQFRLAQQALDQQRWADARLRLLELATRAPGTVKYRALLAYARGQESLAAGDARRARDEWRRALILDPHLADAQRALAAHQSSRTWVDRLLGRA